MAYRIVFLKRLDKEQIAKFIHEILFDFNDTADERFVLSSGSVLRHNEIRSGSRKIEKGTEKDQRIAKRGTRDAEKWRF